MGNERICGIATIRRDVCKVLNPKDCFDDRREEKLCGTESEVKEKLAKLCAGYFTGIGPDNRHHKPAWTCELSRLHR